MGDLTGLDLTLKHKHSWVLTPHIYLMGMIRTAWSDTYVKNLLEVVSERENSIDEVILVI